MCESFFSFSLSSYALWPTKLVFAIYFKMLKRMFDVNDKVFYAFYHVSKHGHRFSFTFMYQALDTIIISFGFFFCIHFAANGKINFSCAVLYLVGCAICSIHFHFISPYN